MTDPNETNEELSLNELKDVSGGLKGDDRGTYGIGGGSGKGALDRIEKKPNKVLGIGADDNETCQWSSNGWLNINRMIPMVT